MSRWFFLVAVLPVCTGCLYYAYPTLTHTPELQVANPDGSVAAFRIDIDTTQRKPLAPVVQYTLTQIAVDARGLIPSQLELAPATGLLNPLKVVEGAEHERSQYTMYIRAYRPGYRLNEVKAWEGRRDLAWSPATDLRAREKAIDDLLAVPTTPDQPTKSSWWELKDEKSPGLGLQPGSVSPSQRKALEFASGEYQRLAASPVASNPTLQVDRERLQQKAIWLLKYADQPPLP